ncbi:MAG TPA: LL-diaminopimelate aminotransferase [Sutterella sp.]|nr:LL-diaminopimelate aminotransferase [Sutterella sp.]
MSRVNPNYLQLKSYLFTGIAQKVAAHRNAHPDQKIISLGIGDVTHPFIPAVVSALHKAVDENASLAGFHGYGPSCGYPFLREAIAQEYARLGVTVSSDEIFVSDGAKSDVGNIQELFSPEAAIAVTNPTYTVYIDSNVMAGRAGEALPDGRFSSIVYLPCTRENGFVPDFLERATDLVYLCYPNNPTGTALTREQLAGWVDWAMRNRSIILFDAAYEAFITDSDVPHSIYEIEGAREVAIEFRSYSKTAGFTGLRCGCTVIPRELAAAGPDGASVPLNPLWNRRQCTKYNGCPYIVQRAAEASHSPEGRSQIAEAIALYHGNAAGILAAAREIGLDAFGGINSPYVWLSTPSGMSSWAFFELLLEKCALICTPGVGFGSCGEGFVRISAFGTREDNLEAISRLKQL